MTESPIRWSYRISDRFYVLESGAVVGVVPPAKIQVFLALFRGGRGRRASWEPLIAKVY